MQRFQNRQCFFFRCSKKNTESARRCFQHVMFLSRKDTCQKKVKNLKTNVLSECVCYCVMQEGDIQ